MIPQHSSPETLIIASELTVRTSRGQVFAPLDLALGRGEVAAVVGGPDTGKSALLLALTGRMQGVEGRLEVDGIDAIARSRAVRKTTSVARIADLIVGEPLLSLEDSITERTLADGAPTRSRIANYLHVAHLLGLDAPLTTLFGTLPPADQTRALVALASILPAPLIVVDDLDDGANLKEQAALWAGLEALSKDGVTIVATTSERAAVPSSMQLWEMESVDA